MNISNIDANFRVDTNLDKADIQWMDPGKKPFSLFGVLQTEGGYMRMQPEIGEKVSESVALLNRHTSGGRVSFETNSPYVAIHAKCGQTRSAVMPATGYGGFDLYLEEKDGLRFTNVFVPPLDVEKAYEGIYHFREEAPRKVLIHFPLYSSVEFLAIGIQQGSTVSPYSPYGNDMPVVFYGSSITQGGCVSRPGNAYPAVFSQLTRRNYINLGFSAGAHGEEEMARYIANLPMSLFVMDYDHNDCDNLSRLAERHPAFYRIVRERNPMLPIVIMSAPYAARTFYESHPMKSKGILKDTYFLAKEAGEPVAFIDGYEIFGAEKDAALADRIHPNDLGHWKMANALIQCVGSMQRSLIR